MSYIIKETLTIYEDIPTKEQAQRIINELECLNSERDYKIKRV
jgi:hypothetical protein